VAASDILAPLLARAHDMAPSALASVVSEEGRALGASELVIYLVDYAQTMLVPIPCSDAADRHILTLEGTLAGRAFRTSTPLESDDVDGHRIWMPVVDGVSRVGVLEVLFRQGPPTDPEREALHRYAGLVGHLVVIKGEYGDVFEFVRRRAPMSVAAELQWSLLPPLTFGTEGIVISGLLEPAYEVGGDSFDYAVNGDLAHFALFDMMGHGLEAASLSSVVIGAYRSARRKLLDLPQTYVQIDRALVELTGGDRGFATGLLAELRLDEGVLRFISAGHLSPLVLREGKVVKSLIARPALPFGFANLDTSGRSPEEVPVSSEQLQPGDRIIAFTDGVVEARRGMEFFGVDRLGDFVAREAAAGQIAPETLRRLTQAILEHQDGALQDDATAMLVEWRGRGPAPLRPDRPAPSRQART
jgi:Stage II sporulation protein E (SpoIIE)